VKAKFEVNVDTKFTPIEENEEAVVELMEAKIEDALDGLTVEHDGITYVFSGANASYSG
jgi:ribosomal protein S6E (S10)